MCRGNFLQNDDNLGREFVGAAVRGAVAKFDDDHDGQQQRPAALAARDVIGRSHFQTKVTHE